jgi:hypothetical protein
MLSEHPAIQTFKKVYGLKIYWIYGENDESWMRDVLLELFKNIDFFEHITHKEFHDLAIPELDNWRLEGKGHRLYNIFPIYSEIKGFDFPMTDKENEEFNSVLDSKSFNICVQLTGKDPEKTYTVEGYIKIFNLILNNYPQSKIYLIDHPKFIVDDRLMFDNRIINCIPILNRLQIVNLIQQVDHLICPDSYSKYIRRWVNKKQSILCGQLSYITPNRLLKDCFGDDRIHGTAGLVFNSNIKLLGATYNDDLTLCDMVNLISDITPLEIYNSIDFEKNL